MKLLHPVKFFFICALIFLGSRLEAQNTCAAPTTIGALPYSATGLTTCGKGNDYQNNCDASYMDGEDYVFSFTPATDMCISVALSNTRTYTGVFVFQGCPAAGSGCVKFATSTTGNPSVTGVNLTGGVEYFIMVDTWPTPACTQFNINVTECPAGTNCTYNYQINTLPFSESNTTCGKSNDYTGPCDANYMDGEDMVYTYTPTANECVNITTSGTGNYTAIFVLDKCPSTATAANCIASATSTTGDPVEYGIDLVAGKTYYIIIDTWPTPTCTAYNINISKCPPGSTCTDAVVIPSIPYNNANTTCGKQDDYTQPANCGTGPYMDGEDIVYTYFSPIDQCVNIKTTGTGNYVGIFVFDRCPNLTTTCVDFVEAGATANPQLGQVTLKANTTYYIVIDTWPTPNCTAFTLDIQPCPPGTNCVNPKVIPAVPYTDNGTTCGMGTDFGLFIGDEYVACAPNYNDDGSDITYTYTAPRNQCINISMSNVPAHREDMAIIVTENCPNAANARCLALSEGNGTAGPAPINKLFLFAGTTIYITVDADDAYFDCTPYTLVIDTCTDIIAQCGNNPAASDNCSGAAPICDFTGYCGSTKSTYTVDQPGNLSTVFCAGIQNNSWVTFVAAATTATLNIYFGNCRDGEGIQAMVFETTNCTNFTARSNCYNANVASGSGTITATGLVPGRSYYLMVDGYNGDGCDYVISASNTSGVLIPVSAGPDVTICPGKSTTLTASNGNNVYTWGPSGPNAKTYTVSPKVTTTYYVTSLYGNIGCPQPGTDSVTVNVVPTVITNTSITQPNPCSPVCDGSATINISGGASPYTTTWSHIAGNVTTVNNLCPNRTYTAITTDATGCSFYDTVRTDPKVTANFTFTPPGCGILTGTLTCDTTSGSKSLSATGPGTMTFTPGAGNSYSFSADKFGTYAVKLTVVGATCTKDTTIAITLREIPVANFSITPPVCGSKTTTMLTDSTVVGGTFNYSGVPSSIDRVGTVGTQGEWQIVSTSFGTVNVTWDVNNLGCTATQTKAVTFVQQPVATFTLSGPLCDSLKFNANTALTAGTGAWTYTGPAGGVVTFTNPSANNYVGNASQYGSYTVTWTVTNGACSATTTQNVDFFKKPVANGGPDMNVCGLVTNLTAVPTVGTGQWAQIDGPDLILFDDVNLTTVNASTSSYGVYHVKWTETNGTCPPSIDTVTIVYSQDPVGDAGADQDICGLSTTLSGTAVIGTGSWSGAGVASPNDPNTPVSVPGGGTRTFTWTVTNGACPPLLDYVDVKFNRVPTPNAGPDQDVCGLTVSLDASPPTGSGTWISPAVSYISTTNPKSNATVPSFGTYQFVWQESNGPCPLIRDTVAITFVETPAPNAGPDQQVCGLVANFNASPSAFSGTWSGIGNIVTPNSRTSQIVSAAYGTFTYVWTEFNASPCPSKTDTMKITFVQQPVANAGADKNVCGKIVSMSAVRSVAGSSGVWSGPSNISFAPATATNPTVTSTTFGTYTLYWSESNTGVCPTSVDSVVVQFVPATNPNAGVDDQTCGLNYTLAAVPSYGLGSWSYTGPGILSFSNINDPNASISATAFGAYRIAWTEDNKPCIANTDTVTINFFETPTVEAGVSPDKVCGLTYTLAATSTVGQGKWTVVPDAGVTGTVTFAGGNDSIPNATVNASDYGKFFFIWTVNNGPCNPPADTVDLTFFKRPVPDAGGDAEVCDDLEVQLSGVTSVSGQWQWTSETGGTITFLPDANRPDPIAQATAPGIYKLYFSEVSDPVCGISTDSLTVKFLELPVADAGADDVACGENFLLAAASPPFGTGKWTMVSTSVPGFSVTIADDTLYNSQISLSSPPPVTGVEITMEWVVTNGICPPVSDQVIVTFKEVPNQVDAGPNDTLCGVLTTTLAGNDNGASGTWSVISQPSGSGPVVFGDVTLQTSDVTVTRSGVYILQRSATVAGCPNSVTDVVTIDFRRMPNPAAGNDTSICGDDILTQAKIPTTTSRITGLWTQVAGPGTLNFADNTMAQTNVSLADAKYGTYTIRFTESNVSCPDISDDVDITFHEQTLSNAGLDQEICGSSYNLQAVVGTANTSPDYVASWTQMSGPGSSTYTPSNTDPAAMVTVDQFGRYVYYWNEVNGVCPATVDSVSILFVNQSNPNAGTDHDVCGVLDTLSAIPSYGKGSWAAHVSNPGPTTFVNPADPHSIIAVNTYGVYRYDWQEISSPCFANSDFTIITFHEQPTSYAGPDKDTCSLIATLEAVPSVFGPGYQGTWSGPVGSVFANPNDPNTTVDVTAVGHGTHVFTWTEINGAACAASTDNVSISFLETPVADVGVNPVQTCGKTLQLNAIPSVGVGVWSGTGIGNASFTNPASPTSKAIVDVYGEYHFTWTEINYGPNGGSCADQDTFTVGFYQQPSAYAGPDTVVCGNTVTLTGSQSVSASAMTWSYVGNPADASFSSTTTPSTSITTNNLYGTYKFVFSEDIGNGACSSFDTIDVTFVRQSVANGGPGDSVCGLTASMTAVPSVGNGSWSSITSGAVITPNLSSPAVSVSVPAFGIYKFVWKEDNGSPCVASRDTVTLGFFQTPKPKAGPDFSICGPTATLAGVPSVYTASWSYTGPKVVGFGTPSSPTSTVTLTPASSSDYGLTVLRLTESNTGVCSAFDEVSVFFSEMPVANAGPDQAICGLDFTMNAAPSVGNGKWNYVGPATNVNTFINTTSPNANGRMAVYGGHDFDWVEKNPGVCPSDTDRTRLIMSEAPIATAGRDTSLCALSYTLTGVASVGTGTWTKASGPGTVSFGNASDDTTSVSVSLQGTYRFAWTEFNSASCPVSSDTVEIYFEKKPIPNAGADFDVCGNIYTLQAVASTGTGTWTYVGDPSATVSFSDINSPNATFTSDKYGPQPLFWTEFVTAQCGAQTDTVVLNFIRQPIAEAGPATATICGPNYRLDAIPSYGVGNWTQISGPLNGTFAVVSDPKTVFSVPTGGFGTYVLRWTETTAGPCVPKDDDIAITFSQQPTAAAGPDQEICGLTTKMDAVPSFGVGTWIHVPTNSQTATFADKNDPKTTVTVTGYGTFRFVWQEANGPCTPSNDPVDITFYQQPIADAGIDTVVCSGMATLKAVTSVGSGVWSIVDPGDQVSFADSTSDTTTASINQFGVHFFKWTETNGKVCPADSDIVMVEYVDQPVASTGGNDRVCGLQYKLKAVPSVLGGTGEWVTTAPGATFVPNANDPEAVVSVSSFGTYNFTWSETSKDPCTTDSQNIDIEFIELPSGVITPLQLVSCDGDPVQLRFDLPTGIGPYTVTYSSTPGGTVTFANPITNGHTISVNPSVTTTYRITSITDGSGVGCKSTTSTPVTVTVNPRPTVSVSGTYTICFGDSLTIPVTLTGTAPFSVGFTNSFPSKTFATSPYLYTFKPGTATSIGTMSITDANCPGIASNSRATINSNPLPSATITHPNTNKLCAGQTTQLQLNFPVGTGPFDVYISDGTTALQPILNVSNGYTFGIVPPAGNTTYKVDSVRDANGCLGTGGNVTVTVYANPTVIATANTPICEGSSTTMVFNFTPTGSGPWLVDYTVDQVTATTPAKFNGQSQTVTPLQSGDIVISQVTDIQTGCVTTMNQVLPIVLIPQPTLSASVNPSEICVNDSTKMTLTLTGVGPFTMTLSDNSSYTNLQNGDSIYLKPTSSQTYTVIAFEDGSGLSCNPTNNVNEAVVVHQLPDVLFDVTDTTSCAPMLPTFTNSTDQNEIASTGGLLWNFGDGGTDTVYNPVHEYTTSGTYPITLSVTSPNNCVNNLTKLVTITINPDPVADFIWTPESPDVIENHVNFINTSLNGIIYDWSIDGDTTGITNKFQIDKVFSYVDSATYLICLTATSIDNCENVKCQYLTVGGKLSVFVPSAFTPNGDGLNDVFVPSIMGADIEDYELIIYNRWGDLVFKSTNPEIGWDGTFKERKLQPENYQWKIEFKDKYTVERHKYYGRLYLVR